MDVKIDEERKKQLLANLNEKIRLRKKHGTELNNSDFVKSEINLDNEKETNVKLKRKRDLSSEEVGSKLIKTDKPSKPTEETTEQSVGPNKRKQRRHRVRRRKNHTVENENSKTEPISEEIPEFTVLGEAAEEIKQVNRRLPKWLSEPTLITKDLTPITEPTSKLDQDIIKGLEKDGITHFFPVQQQVIPVLLSHSHWVGFKPPDVCVCAPTGSGKTLTYVLPLVQILKGNLICSLRALVVLPVKDLALQVFNVFVRHRINTGLRVVLLSGHTTLKEEGEKLITKDPHGYGSGADIVVATPGRLVDHIHKTPGFSLNKLKYLVIDEADRMMTENNHDWLTEVERFMYGPTPPSMALSWTNMEKNLQYMPQKLLFSATLSQDAEMLHTLRLFQPIMFSSQVEPSIDWLTRTDVKKKMRLMKRYQIPETLTQNYILSRLAVRPLVLLHLLQDRGFKHVLCFTATLESAHRLYVLMKELLGPTVSQFSADMPMKTRQKVLESFKQGTLQLLICTDLVARGMDIENVEHVVLYDSPSHVKNYIHRIGRTARAGRNGIAITFLPQSKLYQFKKMLGEAGIEDASELAFTEQDVTQYGDQFTKALATLKTVLKEEHVKVNDRIPGRRKPRRQ